MTTRDALAALLDGAIPPAVVATFWDLVTTYGRVPGQVKHRSLPYAWTIHWSDNTLPGAEVSYRVAAHLPQTLGFSAYRTLYGKTLKPGVSIYTAWGEYMATGEGYDRILGVARYATQKGAYRALLVAWLAAGKPGYL